MIIWTIDNDSYEDHGTNHEWCRWDGVYTHKTGNMRYPAHSLCIA